jgi:hypothetical protein
MPYLHENHDTPAHPEYSDFNTEWRRALRSERFAGRRRRIRALRASTRIRRPGNGTSVARAMRIPVLKLAEAELGFQKTLLKIRGN